MRIVDIRETAIPLKSSLANSSFDFSEMTTSAVAVITDVVREGRPVAGFAFNSTGRYACGAQMRARFIPRILAADPDSLLNDAGSNLVHSAHATRGPARPARRVRNRCAQRRNAVAVSPRCEPSKRS